MKYRPKSRFLRDAEAQLNESLDTYIPRRIAEGFNLSEIAEELGVLPGSVNNWMKQHGYVLESRWVKVEQPAELSA